MLRSLSVQLTLANASGHCVSLQIAPPSNSTVHGTAADVVVVICSAVVVGVVAFAVVGREHDPEMQLRPVEQRPI